jgi:hypothetical protein
MHPILIDWEPTRRHLRTFAWSFALGLALLSWWCAGTGAALLLRWTAAVAFALGAVSPGLFRLPFVVLFLFVYSAAWPVRAIRLTTARRHAEKQ